MTQIDLKRVPRHFIVDARKRMPKSRRTIFADGSADSSFRPGVDLELSHWVPTTTPACWAADTSTEICMRFMEDSAADQYELAVNNHLDVDGILSLFVLLFPELALKNRALIIAAAEHGDLQAAVARPGVVLAEELTSLVARPYAVDETMQDRYTEGFELTRDLLYGSRTPSSASAAAWRIIEQGQRMLEDGTIRVTPCSDLLVSFVLPALTGMDCARALTIPPFSVNIDASVFLWPHSRNIDHDQKLHLISLPTADGWFHDLWLPGYVWANTPNRRSFSWLVASGGSNEWKVSSQRLTAAMRTLTAQETNIGQWQLAKKLTPFSSIDGRGFPVVVAFIDGSGRPLPSALSPAMVSANLDDALAIRTT